MRANLNFPPQNVRVIDFWIGRSIPFWSPASNGTRQSEFTASINLSFFQFYLSVCMAEVKGILIEPNFLLFSSLSWYDELIPILMPRGYSVAAAIKTHSWLVKSSRSLSRKKSGSKPGKWLGDKIKPSRSYLRMPVRTGPVINSTIELRIKFSPSFIIHHFTTPLHPIWFHSFLGIPTWHTASFFPES